MTATTEKISPVLTDQLVLKIEAAGFDSLAATGMTEPLLAKKLGVTQEELSAYREYRSVPVDYTAQKEWMVRKLRTMEAKRGTYYQLTLGDLAEELGTNTQMLNKVIELANVDTPFMARQKVIAGLVEAGYENSLIASVMGVSEKMVSSFDIEIQVVEEEEPKRKMKPSSQYAPKRSGADSHTERIMRFLYQNQNTEGWTRSEIIAAVGDLGVSPWRRISDLKEKGLAEAVLDSEGNPVTRPGETGHDQAVIRITDAGREYSESKGYEA